MAQLRVHSHRTARELPKELGAICTYRKKTEAEESCAILISSLISPRSHPISVSLSWLPLMANLAAGERRAAGVATARVHSRAPRAGSRTSSPLPNHDRPPVSLPSWVPACRRGCPSPSAFPRSLGTRRELRTRDRTDWAGPRREPYRWSQLGLVSNWAGVRLGWTQTGLESNGAGAQWGWSQMGLESNEAGVK